MNKKRKKIAIVGTGISGLAAAWGLYRHHDLTVFEAAHHIGGHANTVEVKTPEGKIPVDTGFIVYNTRNYPNLTALFDHLGVRTQKSSMSFSASLEGGAFEYTGSLRRSLKARSPQVLQWRAWKMWGGIMRLFTQARKVLSDPALAGMTLGEYLSYARFSGTFARDHLLPMCAAIWSCPAEVILNYPAVSFFRFFENHGLFKIKDRPEWRTVTGGSQEYVRKLSAPFANAIHTGRPVVRIARRKNGVRIWDNRGGREDFDEIVLACHADTALGLIANPTAAEARTLGAFAYQDNVAVLHTDPALMPRERRVWSSWNYIEGAKQDESRSLCVSYWMNELQNLPTRSDIFLTLNPVRPPREDRVIGRFWYDHPIFNIATLKGQQNLHKIQGRNRIWFCGAYFGYGFHEDGLQAGLAVAESLTGVLRPWVFEKEKARIAWPGVVGPKGAAA